MAAERDNRTTTQRPGGLLFADHSDRAGIGRGQWCALRGKHLFRDDHAKGGHWCIIRKPTSEDKASGQSGNDPSADATEAQDNLFTSINEALKGLGGESDVMENLLEHINTRITDEGLVIEVYSRETQQIFEGNGATPTPLLQDIATLISQISKTVTNDIAIGAHVRAQPLVARENSVWDLSQQRATQMRMLMESQGIRPERVNRVTGHADREKVVKDPMALRNDRLEIVLLRDVS